MILNVMKFGALGAAELMQRFPNSILMDEMYDEAIMGVNPLNGSIIYSLTEMVKKNCTIDDDERENSEEDEESFGEAVYAVATSIEMLFKEMETLKGDAISPTLFQEFQWESEEFRTTFENSVRLDVGFFKD